MEFVASTTSFIIQPTRDFFRKVAKPDASRSAGSKCSKRRQFSSLNYGSESTGKKARLRHAESVWSQIALGRYYQKVQSPNCNAQYLPCSYVRWKLNG